MNKTMFFALGMAALMVGCTAADKVTNRTLNQEEVMAKMSLEDKAHFVIGVGLAGFSGDDAVIGATKSLVPGAAGTTYPLDSLGIPAVVLADGPAGLRIDATREGDSATYYCTHFPIGTLLASTWNTKLVEEVGQAIGEEVKEPGKAGISGLHSRIPWGVRPRLEGKQRTLLSIQVLTGISWSQLRGLKRVKPPVESGERTLFCSPCQAGNKSLIS